MALRDAWFRNTSGLIDQYYPQNTPIADVAAGTAWSDTTAATGTTYYYWFQRYDTVTKCVSLPSPISSASLAGTVSACSDLDDLNDIASQTFKTSISGFEPNHPISLGGTPNYVITQSEAVYDRNSLADLGSTLPNTGGGGFYNKSAFTTQDSVAMMQTSGDYITYRYDLPSGSATELFRASDVATAYGVSVSALGGGSAEGRIIAGADEFIIGIADVAGGLLIFAFRLSDNSFRPATVTIAGKSVSDVDFYVGHFDRDPITGDTAVSLKDINNGTSATTIRHYRVNDNGIGSLSLGGAGHHGSAGRYQDSSGNCRLAYYVADGNVINPFTGTNLDTFSGSNNLRGHIAGHPTKPYIFYDRQFDPHNPALTDGFIRQMISGNQIEQQLTSNGFQDTSFLSPLPDRPGLVGIDFVWKEDDSSLYWFRREP